MNIYLAIYIIGVLLFLFCFGVAVSQENVGEHDIVIMVVLAFLWPLFLLVACVVLPLIAIFNIGRWLGRKFT